MSDLLSRNNPPAGIPYYSGATPVEFSLRCVCFRRYLVFTGCGSIVGDAEGRARERAAELQATFIDARQTPFILCSCSQVLDFTLDESATIN